MTTTTRLQPCARASRATARASPCVLYGFGWKQRTRKPAGLRPSPVHSARAFGHLPRFGLEIASTGATPLRTSASAGSSRRSRPPESTTTASAWAGGVSVCGQTKRKAQATSQAATRTARTSRRRRITGPSQSEPGTLSARERRPLHVCGPAGRHRHRVQARGCADARHRREPARAGALPRRRARLRAARRATRATSPRCATLVDAHDISLIVPLTDLDHGVLARARDGLGALVLLPAPEIVDALADKWLAHLLFEERGIGSPRDVAARTRCRTRSSSRCS